MKFRDQVVDVERVDYVGRINVASLWKITDPLTDDVV